jgi:hypothetical protein
MAVSVAHDSSLLQCPKAGPAKRPESVDS